MVLNKQAKSLSRVRLCDPMGCGLPGSSVHGISQARILEWVAISFSRGSSRLGLNPGLPHCRQTLYPLSHQGSPMDGLKELLILTELLQVRVLSCLSHFRLFATPWTVAHQAPLSIGFPRQEYWSGLLFASPGDLPDPRIKPISLVSPALQAGSLSLAPPRKLSG